jgi:tetratricopeptide (TPR) repeat protein
MMQDKYRAFQSRIFQLCKLGKYSEAYSLCQERAQLAANEDEKASVSSMIAHIMEREGRFSESADLLRSTAASNPQHRGILDHMMLTLIRLGLYEEAMLTADRLIDLDTKFPYQSFTSSAYFHKAYAAWKSGRLQEAKESLAKSEQNEAAWVDGGLLSKEQLAAKIDQALA